MRCKSVDCLGKYYIWEHSDLFSCAVGASLAVGEHFDLPQPASEFFSARAKALLDIEMDSPTIATVQALVIMSASEAASTRDTRGWLYCGK
jgi:hypothetical protein